MFSNDEIIKIIEHDHDYRTCGEYYEDFIKGSMNLSYEYEYLPELQEALASPTKETSYEARLTTTTITVVADNGSQLLVKEHYSCHSGSRTQWWVFDKSSLKGDVIWEDDDLG